MEYRTKVATEYHAQKQVDAEPEEGKSDPILLFRQRFFKFQRDLRQDTEVKYYDDSKNGIASAEDTEAKA